MKEKTIKEFSMEEEQKVNALIVLGLPRKEARIVVYLSILPSHKAEGRREIEIEASLRQPEVSVGLKGLVKRGFVESLTLVKDLDEIGLALYEAKNARLIKAAKLIGAI